MRTRRQSTARPLAALTIGLAVAALIGALTPMPAVAQQQARAESPEPAPQIELVMDSSGSMNANDAGGQTRIDAAKDAMHTLLDNAPDQAQVGIRFYGHSYPGENEQRGCADTELVAPIGPLDDDAVRSRIDALEPTGFTPIGRALRQAGKDFDGEGKRRIILVSDGEDTCSPPDPCQVAADLAAHGIDLRIDTIGLNVDPAAEKQLRCIAEATGGQYGDASDADELAAQLGELVKRTVQGYNAVGTPVRGSRNGCENAPTLTEGQYLDHVRYGENVWYRLGVRPGQAVRISFTSIATGSIARLSSVGFELRAQDGGELENVTGTDGNEMAPDYADHVNVGAQTGRFGWNLLGPGRSEVTVCAKLINDLDGYEEFPTEIRLELLGEPLTYDDLPKQARQHVTTTPVDSGPNDEGTANSGGTTRSGQPDGGAGDAAGDDATALSAERAGPATALVAGLAVAGLLVGAIAGVGIGRRR